MYPARGQGTTVPAAQGETADVKQKGLHYLGLAGILLVGAILRFANLDGKALWLDEVLTALFSLGQTQADLPLERSLSMADLPQIFAFRPASCAQIAAALRTDSTHPPLFFCGIQLWLRWLQPDLTHLAWVLRSLPALIGTAAIAAMYGLGRVAFSPAAGLISAALMAVSPFAVYLSQEARHYTLPILLITLALLGLVQMQQDMMQRQALRWWVWLGWVCVNGIGLYVHYFYLLPVVAQGMTLLGLLIWAKSPRRYWAAVGLAIAALGLIYLPWIPVLLHHQGQSATDWLTITDPTWANQIAPLYQLLGDLILTVIILPVEKQPAWIALPAVGLMVLFAGWLVRQVYLGWRKLWQHPPQRFAGMVVASFTVWILIQFLAIVYLLQKDLTIAPRYGFVYYPGVCALLGACLAHRPDRTAWRLPKASAKDHAIAGRTALHPAHKITLVAGLLSCLFVVSDLAFHKSFQPQRVAREIVEEDSNPWILAVTYHSMQEIGLGLSYALQIDRQDDRTADSPLPQLIFVEQSPERDRTWQTLAERPQPFSPPLNLWVVGLREMRRTDFPPELHLASSSQANAYRCSADLDEYDNYGFPYLLYRCGSVE